MATYPKLRSKSGMGTDVDPIRLGLAILAFGGATYAGKSTHNELLGALPFVAVIFGVLLGWWVTRNSYLDKIAISEHNLQKLAEQPTPEATQKLREGEGELSLQAGWNIAAQAVMSAIQGLRPNIEMETASAICKTLGKRLPR